MAATPAREPGAPARREAAPPLRPRGSSQGGQREYNERVVLQAVRLAGSAASAEIARLTGLTAQTVSLITKRLLEEGYLLKGTPRRGKVGQPSVPLSLAPDGAHAVGIKLGRRRLDVVLVDFTGSVRARWSFDYRFPDPDAVLAEIGRCFTSIRRRLGPRGRERVQGVGLAAPLAIGGWRSLLGVEAALALRWASIDLRERVAALCEWPVDSMKDTAAACVAELVAGRGRQVHSFLYVFIDTFIGGGLVIDSHVRSGANGNAGAIGSMPLGLSTQANGRGTAPQLLSIASLQALEQSWADAGLALPKGSWPDPLAGPRRALTLAWIQRSAVAIAHAMSSAACLLDLEAVIVDGAIDRALLQALMDATRAALDRYDWEGVRRPELLQGTVGADAGALGGALLPLHANFAPDRDLFIKEA
ncbi:MAG TPA: ROK family transcriptional regulator [Burkholderiaceae bacterium]|nr:ROK family transcriptional regulator [Burkholderiaceae bacterium]